MKILVLHRVPYPRIEYARGIDHAVHDVTYFGVANILATLPPDLRCEAVERPGQTGPFEEARAWLTSRPRHFDRVISLSEYELLDAARLRQWLGAPGATVEDVQLVRDKLIMKNAVRLAGLRVPRFVGLPKFLDRPSSAEWPGRTVLKPLCGASSEDVVIFESPDDLRRAIADRATSVARLDGDIQRIDDYELEEFVSGDILHFDGLVGDGAVLTLTASRYIGTCLGFAKGQPLGSYHFPVSEAIETYVSNILRAVGVRRGAFHLEAIENGEELVFLEVGNRVGGADVVATFELATGVHMPSEELRLLLDEAPSRQLPATQTAGRWYGWFVFPGHGLDGDAYPGVAGVESFREHPAVVRWAELSIGAALPKKIIYSAHEAPIAGIVACDTWRATRDWTLALFAAATPPAPLQVGDDAGLAATTA